MQVLRQERSGELFPILILQTAWDKLAEVNQSKYSQ